MNFYSEDIVRGIIDQETEYNRFYEQVFTLSCKYSNGVVSPTYILSLVHDTTNSIAFRCMDTEFNIHNCPSILIYHKYYDAAKNETAYYILMICTKRSYKGMGYASGLLDDFIGRIRNQCVDGSRCKIVLSSLESAVTFYEEYGFRWTRAPLTDYPKLMEFERYDEEKEYFILELAI